MGFHLQLRLWRSTEMGILNTVNEDSACDPRIEEDSFFGKIIEFGLNKRQ